MRIPIYPIAASVFALAAFITAAFSSGYILPIALGVASAACLVSFATFTLYQGPAKVKEIPIENFSLWADIGEPATGLSRCGAGEFLPAMKMACADLGSLALNSKLLNSRVSMLVGKPDFEGIVKEGLNVYTRNLARDLQRVVESLSSEVTSADRVPGILSLIESCASQTDRIANKFYEFGREKPEAVRVQVEPLRRAAEKLSRDLRLAHTNIADYMKTIIPPAPPQVPQPAPSQEPPPTSPEEPKPASQ